jgi:phosphoribosyl 1,2-cyclic phosphodiesterase
MSLRLTILGSGSSGNCAFIETDSTRLLVDVGFSAKQVEERLASIGKHPTQLHGILITHEHSDHIQGVRVLASKYKIPVYANRMTRAAILENFAVSGAPSKSTDIGWKIFEPGQKFIAGDFDVEPFTIPHDASDPMGFSLRHADQCVVFLTDLGHLTKLAVEKARQANVLILETNHDMKLLQNDPHRPWSVKQRISGRHGHLSNDAAAAGLDEMVSDRLRKIYLSHLSQDCNRPELAESVISKKLSQMGAKQVKVGRTFYDKPCATEILEVTRSVEAQTMPLFSQPSQPTSIASSP